MNKACKNVSEKILKRKKREEKIWYFKKLLIFENVNASVDKNMQQRNCKQK